LGTGGGGAVEDDEEDEDRCAVDKRLAITRTALERTDAAVEVVDEEECEGPEDDDTCAKAALFCSSAVFLSEVAVGGGVGSDFFSGSRSTT
jgi:hypothetical protein